MPKANQDFRIPRKTLDISEKLKARSSLASSIASVPGPLGKKTKSMMPKTKDDSIKRQTK